MYNDPQSASEAKIIDDAELVYNFLLDAGKLAESDIIITGRSMGSGPSIHLASKYNPSALVLISPFLSIKTVAKNIFGFVANILAEQFDN